MRLVMMRQLSVSALFCVVLLHTTNLLCAADNETNVSTQRHPFFEDGRWGYLDNRGRVAIAPRFKRAEDFVEQRAAVEVDSGIHGYIKSDGSWVVRLPKRATATHPFSEGRAWFHQWVAVETGFESRYGCLDREGRVVVPPKYAACRDFSEGLAAVMVGSDEPDSSVDSRWGYIDRNGDVVIPMEYEFAGDFGDGLALVRRPGKRSQAYIDRTGRTVFSLDRFVQAPRNMVTGSRFHDGRARLVSFDNDGKVSFRGLINVMGKPVWRSERVDWIGRLSEGLAAVRMTESDEYGFINENGEITLEAKYEVAGQFREGLCRVFVGDQWQYIDRKGRVVAQGAKDRPWNDAEDFHGGLARVHIGGEFHETEPQGPNLWRGGAWYYIDQSGVIVSLCRKDGQGFDATFGKELGPP